jgi:hypothetical protein
MYDRDLILDELSLLLKTYKESDMDLDELVVEVYKTAYDKCEERFDGEYE